MGFKEFKAIFFNSANPLGIEIQNVVNIKVIRTLNAKSNTVEILINNYSEESVENGTVKYKKDDTIKVYAADGNVSLTNPVHLVGTFTILNTEVQPVPHMVKLICGDKTFEMLSKVIIERWTGKTSAQIIDLIVQRINQQGNTQTPVTSHMAATKSDTTAFPTFDYTSANKTSYDVITELSQTQYTGDNKPYMFWFDENEEFWWEYMTETPSATVFEHGVNTFDMKILRKQSDTIAMMIYDAGLDLIGNSYIDFTYNQTASSIKGHIKFQPMTDIGPVYRQEIKVNNSLADTSNTSILTVMTNAQFQTELKKRADAVAGGIINNMGTGLWSATLRVTGQKLQAGGYYPIKAVSSGFAQTNMRITRVDHDMNKNGWSTKLTLSEDPSKQ